MRQAVDGSGAVVVEDPATRERRTAEPWTPRGYGEIRAAPKTPLDRLLDEEIPVGGADPYAPREVEGAGNVVAMPVRAAPAAPLEDPLDGDRCADLAAAMRTFSEHYPWPLSAALRAGVERDIEARGLRRSAAIELAQELTALARRKK